MIIYRWIIFSILGVSWRNDKYDFEDELYGGM
jgi:hypothetical protein